MPDLHKEAVHAFWDSYDRRTLYRIVVALEHVEHWALDDDEQVEAGLIRLGEAIDSASDVNLPPEDQIIRILVNTHSTRAFRMLQAIDMAKPGAASQILMHAEEVTKEEEGKQVNPHAKLFLRRNLVFERLQLLSRVFAPQRISLVLNALEAKNA